MWLSFLDGKATAQARGTRKGDEQAPVNCPSGQAAVICLEQGSYTFSGSREAERSTEQGYANQKESSVPTVWSVPHPHT